jgi:plastocyanin
MPATRSSIIPRLALAALLAACGDGYGSSNSGITGTTTSSTSNAVRVADNSFTPSATTVAPGTTVTWTWAGAREHNVTFDDGTASATQTSGTFQRTFSAAGTFSYHCTIHGTAMSGVVTVR